LRELGIQREKMVGFFHEFAHDNDNILFDGTDLVSNSKKMYMPKTGKSKNGVFEKLINIMFVFSVDSQLPVYYRIMPGNIKDIKAFRLCLEESNVKNAVIIADKGFYSGDNIKMLEQEGLRYIIPLRRNNSLIRYEKIQSGDMAGYDGYFKYSGRIIWFYTLPANVGKIYVYMDQELKSEEMKDYVKRTESLPEKFTMDSFMKKQFGFGTIALLNNIEKSAEETYGIYKNRSQVETMIDALKNIIDADSSYMQNENSLEAWMFINYIALHWYYKLLHALKKSKLNHRFSPMDLILFLKEIKYIRINDQWHLVELTKKYQDILKSINIHIT
jgi:transposase